MATLQEQLKRSKLIQPKKLSVDLFKFIRSIEKEFLEIEKRLSEESKDIFGKPIGFYSGVTDYLTNGKKAEGDPFTGIDTGDWMKGFFMQEVSGVLRFGSTDEKNSIILSSENWLSDQLFGLSDKDLKDMIQKNILPFFIKNIRENLNL